MKAHTWGSDPEFYGPRHAVREAMMFKTLARALPPPARVLDAGAGAGSFARRLAGAGYETVGVEPASAFVARVNATPQPRLTFQAGDMTALPFPDARFDAAVAGEVLEHIADHDAAVAELARVLVPGGFCLVTVPADPSLWDRSDDWAGHVRRYTEPELRALFTRHGFNVLTCRRWGFPLTRLYHRHVYLRLLDRKAETGPSAPLTGWKRGAAKALEAALRLDHVFDGSPWGIGVVLTARKR